MNHSLLFETFKLLRICPRSVSTAPAAVVKEFTHLQPNFAVKQKAEVIHQVLGIKVTSARALIRKDAVLSHKPFDHYKQIAKVLGEIRQYSLKPKDTKKILLTPPSVLRRNGEFLKDCGARNASLDFLAACHEYMNVPIGIFRSYANLDKSVDLIENWIKSLPESCRSTATEHVQLNSPVKSSLSHIRNVIFASYLAKHWKTTFEEALTLVEDGLKSVPVSPKRAMKAVELLSEIGFSRGEIWTFPALLQSDPASLKQFLQTHKRIFLGKSTTQFLISNPEVTSQLDFEALQTNVNSLIRFGVPPATIRTNLPIVLLEDPLVLQEKLRQIESYPEISVFCHHPKFAKLLEDIDTVALRVEAFRAIDRRRITFTACTCSPKEFSAILQQRAFFRLSEEAITYLANETGQIEEKIREVLRLHPHSEQLVLANMKKVIELLISKNFTKEQLFNGIQLVLYPAALVSSKLAELPNRPDMQPYDESVNDPYILHILLYLVEEQYSFTGKGVFAKMPEEM